jgi:hypothetical protein
MFHIILRINSDYFANEHQLIGLCMQTRRLFFEEETGIFKYFLQITARLPNFKGLLYSVLKHRQLNCSLYVV